MLCVLVLCSQAVLLNLLLRNFLHYNLYEQVSFPLCKNEAVLQLLCVYMNICDLICEKGPLGANYLLELWSKISNQPKICQFLDYSSITNYYPLPTFWHKSDARACCCCCTRSVYFYPLDPPSIACNEGVVTWRQCYHGNGGSLTSVKDRFSA